MMFGPRWEIVLKMHLQGPLHIGSGIAEKDAKLLSEQDVKDGKEPPEVSLVQRDKDGNAVIPATSLKGALRSQAPLSTDEFNSLFGEQGEAEKGKGRIARLWLGAAIAGDQGNRSFRGMTKDGGLRRQGFVKTAVRIHRQSGTSEEHLLYNREVIGEGVTFDARAILFLDGADDEAVIEHQLAHLLAPLASPIGLSIGGQHRQAGGRLRLDDLIITRRTIDPASLDLTEQPEPEIADRVRHEAAIVGPRCEHEVFRLRLVCDGPYISMRDKTKQDGDESEETRPLRAAARPQDEPDAGGPLLWPSSLLGALRARAAWIAERERLRGYPGGFDFACGREPDQTIDDRDDRIVLRESDVAALSSVERLFGVAGWRGLIGIASLALADDCPVVSQPMTSVTIDRFTGGGIDQRLFTEQVFLGARFDCELRLEARAKDLVSDAQREADLALFNLLLADVGKKGLELGHGAAKGFGWFDVIMLGPDRETRL